jgi:hypothetical protein
LAIALDDRAVLGAIEVELEHDPVGRVELVAGVAREQRTQRTLGRPLSDHDGVSDLLEERRLERHSLVDEVHENRAFT